MDTPAGVELNLLHMRKQDLVRGAIWDAAIDLFAESGFEETTVEDIARAAGVSTRTFFRYFSSKNDLMGQGMIRYASLLSDAVHTAPKTSSPLQIVRYTAQRVASQAAAEPRVRQIVKIASSSVAAREAQLSRRAEVEDTVARAFAARCRTAPGDEVTPRLLTGMALSILDVTFRVWSSSGDTDIVAIIDDVIDTLATLASNRPAPRKNRPASIRRAPKTN